MKCRNISTSTLKWINANMYSTCRQHTYCAPHFLMHSCCTDVFFLTCCQSLQSHSDPMHQHGSSHEAHCLRFAQKHSHPKPRPKPTLTLTLVSIAYRERKWIDVDPEKFSQGCFEVSKFMIRLLRHDDTNGRKVQGKV